MQLDDIAVLVLAGNRKQAWEQLSRFLAVNSDNEKAWLLAFELAKPDKRQSLIEKALQHIPNSPELINLSRDDDTTEVNSSTRQLLMAAKTKLLQSYKRRFSLFAPIALLVLMIFLCYISAYEVKPLVFLALIILLFISGVFARYYWDRMEAAKGWEPKRSLEYSPKPTVDSLHLTTTCKICNNTVAVTAQQCPHCGSSYPGLKVSCRRCGSDKTVVGKSSSFRPIDSAIGLFLVGLPGLLTGFLGTNRIEAKCLHCGLKWDVIEAEKMLRH